MIAGKTRTGKYRTVIRTKGLEVVKHVSPIKGAQKACKDRETIVKCYLRVGAKTFCAVKMPVHSQWTGIIFIVSLV